MLESAANTERFWQFVDRSGDGCWHWRGALDARGYGKFHGRENGRDLSLYAHRVAFMLATGTAPDCVCHHCDNPRCVNPSHLFAGDRAANNRDMLLKGRHAAHTGAIQRQRGDRHHAAKLSDSDIPAIRALATAGVTQRDIARRYGVSQRTINKIVNRIGWTHV